MNEQTQTDFDETVVVPNIDEVKTIPSEELPVFDVDAKDIRFDDEVFLQTEDEEKIEEDITESPKEFITIKTHNIDEAIPGTLEEV